MNTNYIALSERFIAAVARAFYTDAIVVVIDALVKYKYIRLEEFAPRLRMTNKELQKLVNQLESEMMIKSEDVMFDLKQELKTMESMELHHVYFECPNCKIKWSELEAQRSVSKDKKFVCSSCCPGDNVPVSSVMSEDSFRLVMIDNKSKIEEFKELKRKMTEQLNETDDHEGIYALLDLLHNVPLIRNKPSDNIRVGIVNTKVTDKDALKDIVDNESYRGKARKISSAVQEIINKDKYGQSFTVEINTGSTGTSGTSSSAAAAVVQSRTPKLLEQPEFLKDSHVIGSAATMAQVQQIQLQRQQASQDFVNAVPSSSVTQVVAGQTAEDAMDEDVEDDDVNWESGGEDDD